MSAGRDIHSFSEPEKVQVRHCSLDLEASFESRILTGTARLVLTRHDGRAPLTLDTRDLLIQEVRCGKSSAATEESYVRADYRLRAPDPILGSALEIDLAPGTDVVVIQYSTLPHASGLQWLAPEQTADKRYPFLFSQNQSIHARSWIPLQDSPGVRITYDARIEALGDLTVLMGARRHGIRNGAHVFSMDLPVPPYLVALAIGRLEFFAIGPRTGLYAEPSMLALAAREFADMERLVEAVEALYGPYRWNRYDLLILPPSFPFGGMENPMLTFATPTVIAGDKSLVGLVSHELAHSWSGNLVTNATWGDFWLNEGFTTYIENRIQELIYGREQALMEQVLDRRELEKEIREFDARDQILHIDLNGRDPDDGTTRIPYIKGALLLRQMEQVFGRSVLDGFLKSYFDHFAFQSITTDEALTYLRSELFDRHPERARRIPLEEWIYAPGLPASAPQAVSEKLQGIANLVSEWLSGKTRLNVIETDGWNTQQWLEFLQILPHPLGLARMAELDEAFPLTQTGNYEVLQQWLLMAVENDYERAYRQLEHFLLHVGRIKYLKPLYAELMKTDNGQVRAREIYARARPRYHPIAQTAIGKIVKV